MATLTVVKFETPEGADQALKTLEDLQRQIAKELGYELVGHRLELYGTPLRGRKPGPRQ